MSGGSCRSLIDRCFKHAIVSLPVKCIEGVERGKGGEEVDDEGRLSPVALAMQHMERIFKAKSKSIRRHIQTN